MTRLWMCAGALLLAGCGEASDDQSAQPEVDGLRAPPSFGTKVLTAQTAKASEEDWGTVREYFAGETAGVKRHPQHRNRADDFRLLEVE